MTNTKRGEFAIEIGDLEVTICPSYGRRVKAEAALGKSIQGAIYALQGDGIRIDEQANFLHQLSRPRVKLEEIGEALAGIGSLPSAEILGNVLTNLAKGNEDSDVDSEETSEDDDAGK